MRNKSRGKNCRFAGEKGVWIWSVPRRPPHASWASEAAAHSLCHRMPRWLNSDSDSCQPASSRVQMKSSESVAGFKFNLEGRAVTWSYPPTMGSPASQTDVL